MKAKCYRTVFNAARGMLVAVEESARRTGKGRNSGRPSQWASIRPDVDLRGRTGGAESEREVADTGPQHSQSVPVEGVATNGTPVININAPSPAGVNSISFTNYDVDQAGVLLNSGGHNSPTRRRGLT